MSMFEPLERRTLMSSVLKDSVLTVQGTNGDDTIQISQEKGYIIVTFNGDVTRAIHQQNVKQIDLFGGKGDDRLSCGSITSPIPVLEVGGDGSDTLIGNAGKDTLIGGNADDRLTSKDGSDINFAGYANDTIQAGSGSDIIFPGPFNNPTGTSDTKKSTEEIDFGTYGNSKTRKYVVVPDDFEPKGGSLNKRGRDYIAKVQNLENYRPNQTVFVTTKTLPTGAFPILPGSQPVRPLKIGFTKIDNALTVQLRLPATYKYVVGQISSGSKDDDTEDTYYISLVPYTIFNTHVAPRGVLATNPDGTTDVAFKISTKLDAKTTYKLRLSEPDGTIDFAANVGSKGFHNYRFNSNADITVGPIPDFNGPVNGLPKPHQQ